MPNISKHLLTIVLVVFAGMVMPAYGQRTSAPDPVYMQVVDCAFPPVTFSAMAGAFSEEAIVPNFSGLAPGDTSAAIMHKTFNRVKDDVRPEHTLKQRLALYFASKFTLPEANEIVQSCAASSKGFTNKDLLDRFQASMDAAPEEAQKQSVLVTCMFLGKYLTELSTALAPLTFSQLGLKTE